MLQGVSGVNNDSTKPLFHPKKGTCLHGVCSLFPPPPRIGMECISASRTVSRRVDQSEQSGQVGLMMSMIFQFRTFPGYDFI